MLSQTVANAQAIENGLGGINPQQMGLGVKSRFYRYYNTNWTFTTN